MDKILLDNLSIPILSYANLKVHCVRCIAVADSGLIPVKMSAIRQAGQKAKPHLVAPIFPPI
jgi:hypothetical protein